MSPGATYTISGHQFNGVTQGAVYGDDAQGATNYPIVRIVNQATGHVFYARAFGSTTTSIYPGVATQTQFEVPASIETGKSSISVVANGIASRAFPIWVNSGRPGATASKSSK